MKSLLTFIAAVAVLSAPALAQSKYIKDTAGGVQITRTAEQKLSFHGSTPAAQQTGAARPALQTYGLIAADGTTTASATAGAATLSKAIGTITSEALTTAAGADYTLTLTNTLITATSHLAVSADNGTNTTEGLSVQRVTPGSGSAVIKVRNTHASDALNGTIKIRYVILQ